MLDDFFIRALVAGIGVAIVSGPLGCFIVWRRMAYFGDTLAHAALLGVAMALLVDINVTLAVFAVSAAVSLALVFLQKRATLSSDALAWSFVPCISCTWPGGLAMLAFVRVDLLAVLFGDILAVSKTDIVIIYGGGAAVLAVLMANWHSLFAATVSPELARAEGVNPDRDQSGIHAPDGYGDCHFHENRRCFADYRHADHSGRNSSPVCVFAGTNGYICRPDRLLGRDWRPVWFP